MQNAFITGNSSGLGLGLTQVLLSSGSTVYGCSRRGCPIDHSALHDEHLDLSELGQVSAALDQLLGSVTSLDLMVLNAGVLGEIRLLSETSLPEIYEIMDINVWANKLILDWLIDKQLPVSQIVLISSGAAVRGNKGWGAYALSKAALNMLAQLYAHELPSSHVTALAPGLVDTAMQDYLCDPDVVDAEDYPSVEKLRQARGSEHMPTPEAAAEQIIRVLPHLKTHASGEFLDMRTL